MEAEKFVVEAWDSVDYTWYMICKFSNKECVSPKSEALSYLEALKEDDYFKNKGLRVIQVIEEYS